MTYEARPEDRSATKKEAHPKKLGWASSVSCLKVAGLENKPETKTDLTRNLTGERLIKPHVSGDTIIRQSGQDLIS